MSVVNIVVHVLVADGKKRVFGTLQWATEGLVEGQESINAEFNGWVCTGHWDDGTTELVATIGGLTEVIKAGN